MSFGKSWVLIAEVINCYARIPGEILTFIPEIFT